VIASALLALSLCAPSPAAAFDTANTHYLQGDFEGAARAYEALAADGWVAAALELNLGNARFRLGQRGRAIAAWERALRLDPGDADARANLEAARTANVDRIVGAERSLLERLVERTPDLSAAAAFLASWAALWAALAARRVAATRRPRAVLGAAAIAAAFMAIPAGGLLALRAADRRTPAAVVIAAATPLREGPSAALRPTLELHEGTRVRVLEARDDLVRVRLENGLEGWAAARDLERISP
jgi:tetratricopeptide repeat protein